jgi:molecular chaperone GrpE
LAQKKKTTRKAAEESEARPAGPDPTENGAAADAAHSEEGRGRGRHAEPVEKKQITIGSGEDDSEDTGEADDRDAVEAAPRSPSAKEVLNRLLEKNEIILKLNKDNAEKDKQLKSLNEKWLRSVAEFENYRKRSRKEWELLKQQSKTEVILEILDIIDDFERAFSAAEDADDEFVQGIKLIYSKLIGVLQKFGVREIESLNSPFDPNFHMAVGQLDAEDVEPGRVAEVIQKGYLLDDTVIRPARVIVAK